MDVPLPRLIVFVVLATYITLGPAWRQLAGGTTPFVRQWVMYRSWGTTGCDVRFYQRTEEGDVRLDRYAVLDREPWYAHPVESRRLTSRAEVLEVARRLCDALGRGADLRIDARCGSDDGWVQHATRENNLCR